MVERTKMPWRHCRTTVAERTTVPWRHHWPSSVPCLLATPMMTAAAQMMEHDNDGSGTDNGA